MATPRPVSYRVASGGIIYGGRFAPGQAVNLVGANSSQSASSGEGAIVIPGPVNLVGANSSQSASSGVGSLVPAGFPAWRAGMAQWGWLEIPNTAYLSDALPTDTSGLANFGSTDTVAPRSSPLKGRFAYGGFAVKDTTVYLAGGGGHADWYGNENYGINLNAAAPLWNILSQPTPRQYHVVDSDFYLDGRPPSIHTYYTTHAVGNELVRAYGTAVAGSGNFNSYKGTAFSLTTMDWVTGYPDAPESHGGLGVSICKDARNDNIYYCGNTRLNRRAPNGTWTQLATFIQGSGSGFVNVPSDVDTSRDHIVFFGDVFRNITNQGIFGGVVYNIVSNTYTQIVFSGDVGSDEAVIGRSKGAVWYNPTLDRFILKSEIGKNIYLIHPTTWVVTAQTTNGGTTMAEPAFANGVFNKFIQVPALGGIFYHPHHDSNAWFLATE